MKQNEIGFFKKVKNFFKGKVTIVKMKTMKSELEELIQLKEELIQIKEEEIRNRYQYLVGRCFKEYGAYIYIEEIQKIEIDKYYRGVGICCSGIAIYEERFSRFLNREFYLEDIEREIVSREEFNKKALKVINNMKSILTIN